MNARSVAIIASAATAAFLLSSCSAGGTTPRNTSDAESATSVAPSPPEQPRAKREQKVENIDVCAALPLETVITATGRTFATASAGTSVQDGIPIDVCAYQGAGEDLASLLVMSVFVYPSGGAAAVTSYQNKFGGGTSPTPLSGVGDSAQSSGHDLVARFGDQVIAVVDGAHGGYPDDFTIDKRVKLVQAVHDAL
ncbi:hypothetical protein ACVXZ4_10865 [Lacisediminihabitans sp. FW035]